MPKPKFTGPKQHKLGKRIPSGGTSSSENAPKEIIARPKPRAPSNGNRRHTHASDADEAPGQAPGDAPDKAERNRQAMMQYLQRSRDVTWYSCVDLDATILCGPFLWRVHQLVIRKCPYFASRLPPQEAADGPTDCTLELHQHDPGQLSNVLRFMYYRDYPGASYDDQEPLYADCLVTNTAMYVAAASVECESMMQFALKHIEAWTTAVLRAPHAQDGRRDAGHSSPLQNAIRNHPILDYAVLHLADRLRRSLAIVYEQPQSARAGQLFDLRVALVRFVDAALPYLAANLAFRVHFRNEWSRAPEGAATEEEGGRGMSLADNIAVDHDLLSALNMLPRRTEADSSAERPLPTFGAILALLQKLAKAERTWIIRGPRSAAEGGDATDHHFWRLHLASSLFEHEMATRILMSGLKGILTD